MLKITKNQGSIQVTADKSGFYPFDGTITFPTNSLFTATSANTDMITFKSTSNGDVQFVGNYKDITISGRSYDTKQKFLTAFSNLANQGSGTVDAYTKAETDAKLNDKLTAQTNANGALFISSSSNDDANNSVALYNSTVKGSNDVAIGFASTPDKEGIHNLAMLYNAQANGIQNIAIGAFQRCKGISNIGIGVGASDPNTVDVNGQGNVCIGASSQAHTASNTAVNNSIAIGVGASASSNFCTVIGNSANSKSSHAVAVGDNAYVDHDCDSSVAVGNSARAYGKNSVAIGCTSYADNDKPLDICCGKKDNNEVLSVLQSDATGKLSILKGDGTIERMVIQDEIEALKNAGGGTVDGLVINGYKVAAGLDQTSYTNRGSVVIGNDAEAYNDYSVLIGQGVKGRCDDAVVIGRRAETTTNSAVGSVVIGTEAKSSAEYGVSIGRYAESNDTTPLVINAGVNGNSIRLTMIQGDANGKISLLKGDGTDERMVIQDEIEALKNAGGGGGTVDTYTKAETDTKLDAKQDKLTAGSGITITKDETAGTSTIATAVSLTDNGNGAYQVGDSIGIGGSLSVRIGNNTSALKGQNSIAIGNNAVVNNKNSIAIGDQAITSDENCIAIGNNANTTYYTSNCVVIGNNAQAASSQCTVIGPKSRSNTSYAVAVGYNIYIDSKGRNSVAVGSDTKAYGQNSVALGYSSQTTDDKPLVINAGKKTVNGITQPLTVLQSDATGKISVLLGDGTDTRIVISDEIAALKAEITTLKAEIAALKGGASTGA